MGIMNMMQHPMHTLTSDMPTTAQAGWDMSTNGAWPEDSAVLVSKSRGSPDLAADEARRDSFGSVINANMSLRVPVDAVLPSTGNAHKIQRPTSREEILE